MRSSNTNQMVCKGATVRPSVRWSDLNRNRRPALDCADRGLNFRVSTFALGLLYPRRSSTIIAPPWKKSVRWEKSGANLAKSKSCVPEWCDPNKNMMNENWWWFVRNHGTIVVMSSYLSSSSFVMIFSQMMELIILPDSNFLSKWFLFLPDVVCNKQHWTPNLAGIIYPDQLLSFFVRFSEIY